MTPKIISSETAIETLRGFQSQIIDGKNTFGDIADLIERTSRKDDEGYKQKFQSLRADYASLEAWSEKKVEQIFSLQQALKESLLAPFPSDMRILAVGISGTQKSLDAVNALIDKWEARQSKALALLKSIP